MKNTWKLKAVIAALPILIMIGCGDDDENLEINRTLVRQHTCSLPVNTATNATFGATSATPIASFTLPSELSTDEDREIRVQMSLQNTFGQAQSNTQTITMNARATTADNVRLTGSGMNITINSNLTVSASGSYNGVTLNGSKNCSAVQNTTGFSNTVNNGFNTGVNTAINPQTGLPYTVNPQVRYINPQVQYVNPYYNPYLIRR